MAQKESVLVIGEGAREDAICWKLQENGVNPSCMPGNTGTARWSQAWENPNSVETENLATWVEENNVSLTIVGPEGPLVSGIVDEFRKKSLRIFGPDKYASQIEGSKIWADEFMRRYNIPTPDAFPAYSVSGALITAQVLGLPVAVKMDGLAAGKGVSLIRDERSLTKDLKKKLTNGKGVLLQEYVQGPEISMLAFCDGENFALMPPIADTKWLNGKVTGGVRAYSHPIDATPEFIDFVGKRVFRPALDGLAKEGHSFVGVLYVGMIIGNNGPQVLEFNCRFGDPETQAILPLMDSDLLEVINDCNDGRLDSGKLRWKRAFSYALVLCSEGYPDTPIVGREVHLQNISRNDLIFWAGAKHVGNRTYTAGGRVATAVGVGMTRELARLYSHTTADKVNFAGMQRVK